MASSTSKQWNSTTKVADRYRQAMHNSREIRDEVVNFYLRLPVEFSSILSLRLNFFSIRADDKGTEYEGDVPLSLKLALSTAPVS